MQICGSYRSGIRWVWNSLVIELFEQKKNQWQLQREAPWWV